MLKVIVGEPPPLYIALPIPFWAPLFCAMRLRVIVGLPLYISMPRKPVRVMVLPSIRTSSWDQDSVTAGTVKRARQFTAFYTRLIDGLTPRTFAVRVRIRKDGSTDLETLQPCQVGRFSIKAPKGIASEQESRGDMEKIVSTATVTRGPSQRKFLELLFKLFIRDRYGSEKLGFLSVIAEIPKGERRLLGRNIGLAGIISLKHVELKRI